MNKPIIIDTNILIGFELWVPKKVHPIFWSNLEEKISEGKIILLDVVMNETTGDILHWCKNRIKNQKLLSYISDDDRLRAFEINKDYPIIDRVALKSEVDPLIIAFAERNNYMICSRESKKRPNENLYKIPDVCNLLNIQVTSKPSGLYTRTGLNFE